MAFVFIEKGLAWWPVTAQRATDGGVLETVAFEAQFELLPDDDYRKKSLKGDVSLLSAVVKAVRGINDEHGKELPSSPALIKTLIGYQWLRIGLVRASMEAQLGAPAKNLQRLPEPGPSQEPAQPISPKSKRNSSPRKPRKK